MSDRIMEKLKTERGAAAICRLCATLRKADCFVHIRDPNLHIPMKLERCCQVSLPENDNLPENVCLECVKLLDKCWVFAEKVKEAQESLHALYAADEVEVLQVETQDDSNKDDYDISKALIEVLQGTESYKKEPTGSISQDTATPTESKSEECTLYIEDEESSENDDTIQLEFKDETEVLDEDGAEFLEIASNQGYTTEPIEVWRDYPWICKTCNIYFGDVLELRNHMRIVHDTNECSYVCADCSKTYVKYYLFFNHVLTHRRHLNSYCDLCSEFCETPEVLARHRDEHQNEDGMAFCSICAKGFKSVLSLNSHLRIHKEEQLYQCSVCDKKFVTKPNLKAHQRIHYGVKEFVCHQCGKGFVQKANLEEHLITHLKDRPFPCDECDKKCSLHTLNFASNKGSNINSTTQTDISLKDSMEQEILDLRRIMKIMTKERVKTLKKLQELQSFKDSVKEFLTPGQVKKIERCKRVAWSADDISSAITLYAAGPRAYRLLLRRNFPFPAVSTLKKWAQKVTLNTGILEDVIKLLENSCYEEKEKLCVIMFDEMQVRACYEYDQRNDKVVRPGKYAQVAMLRGLATDWKQVIYFDFDQRMTMQVLKEIILRLQAINFHVVATVCDMGPSNFRLLKELGVDEEHPSFIVSHQTVHVFTDTPHLIKLIRNHFIDTGFKIDGILVNADPIRQIIRVQKNDLKVAHKLTSSHIDCRGAQRQKVKLATQLFSNTVSSAIKRCVANGTICNTSKETALETSNFVKLVNDWFDVFNSKVPAINSISRMKAFGLDTISQQAILNRMTQVVKSLKVGSRKSLLPFQKGIILNNASLNSLLHYLHSKYNISFILTNRLCQDPLEHFFGIIRSKGGLHDHPSCMEFKYRLRMCLLGRTDDNQRIVSYGNVSTNEDTYQQVSENMLKRISKRIKELPEYEINFEDSPIITPILGLNIIEEDALNYLSGYIIKKLNLGSSFISVDCNDSTWVDELSEGGLMKPKKEFEELIVQLERIFLELNKAEISFDGGILKSLMNSSVEVPIDTTIKNLYFRSRIYFRIKHLNLQLKSYTSKRRVSKKCNLQPNQLLK